MILVKPSGAVAMSLRWRFLHTAFYKLKRRLEVAVVVGGVNGREAELDNELVEWGTGDPLGS
jgi:hypothetical protein